MRLFINLPQYLECALEIQAHQDRDPHLITEWCLDIYPCDSYAARVYVREKILEALRHE